MLDKGHFGFGKVNYKDNLEIAKKYLKGTVEINSGGVEKNRKILIEASLQLVVSKEE